MLKVGLTGGIGSGKSLVCSLFEKMGVPVYDSDDRAKVIIGGNPEVIAQMKELFGEVVYKDGMLDRKLVASKVFVDKTLLAKLNGIVHPAVIDDFRGWCQEQYSRNVDCVIMECAILFESKFECLVDKVVCVTAPLEVRIERVMARDGVSKEDVYNRINNQMGEDAKLERSDYEIVNGVGHLIVPQVVELCNIFRNGVK